jgi:Putative lumazine-binding
MTQTNQPPTNTGRFTDYNDFLTLIKLDGGWKVIAKVYHQFEG